MANISYRKLLNLNVINSRKSSREFGGLVGMSTASDKKDLLQMPQFNKSHSTIEKSMDFLKSTQNEIYFELHKELDELKMENKELKLKLVLLSNSSDILTNFPTLEPNMLVKDEGIQVRLLKQRIKELNTIVEKEVKQKELLEEKIHIQEQQSHEKKEINDKEIAFNTKHIDESNKNTQSSFLQSPIINADLEEIKLLNQQIIISTSKLRTNNFNFPSTIQGCHSLITSLLKSKDRMNTKIQALEMKLKNCQQVFQKSEFMITKNLTENKESYYSIVSNNSNYKRYRR